MGGDVVGGMESGREGTGDGLLRIVFRHYV